MDAIKQAVVQTLEKQGIIAQLKAQLRAQVFLAVEEYDSTSSASGLASKTVVPARNSLLSEADGQLAVQLVLDLLDTCNFAFTKRVFQPELGSKAPDGGRQTIAQTLGLQPASHEEPLLVTLIKAFKAGSSARPTSSSVSSGVPAGAAPVSARPAEGSSSASTRAAAAATPTPGPLPASGPASSSSSAPVSTARATAPVAPVSRLEPIGKPALAPLPQLGVSAARQADNAPTQSAAAPAAAKPQPEQSGDEGYDDDFDVVEDDDELLDPDAIATGDDEDDLAAALGCKTTSVAASKDGPDGGRERPGAGFGGSGGSSGRGRTALDADLMAGDRSFGVSNELAGLDVGNSGGLSYSADFPGGTGDMRASLSTSQAMLSPISEGTPKVSKLDPLRPIGGSKLSPLAPLAPLTAKSSSLSSSKDDPLGSKGPKSLGPLGAPVRKSVQDIEKEKEEMRRLVLLQSGDSLSNSIEVESRPRPAGAPSNIYDAEMSVSASMDDQSTWGAGSRDERPPFGSKGISMDLGATGLSASDRSGDIEHLGVDLAETAEWH
ncbi:hypothetical protein PLESTB_001367500 [Pleodorina starrii]|uniref:FGFR1 oncogene partner n=1 Tax=Pleodorina starrii TaxID=330485 RepID=A0A9W6F6P9_9CHLO|nr:hypothetical protein PLESTM_000417700 [Pleodorina starrii]GLC58497.1 hypothetical protein PLESTB_001367500 [Pleodorina starrii]GLC74152.1 hypothetical protein PLESTF_001467500 [Pleodorina starrii]